MIKGSGITNQTAKFIEVIHEHMEVILAEMEKGLDEGKILCVKDQKALLDETKKMIDVQRVFIKYERALAESSDLRVHQFLLEFSGTLAGVKLGD